MTKWYKSEQCNIQFVIQAVILKLMKQIYFIRHAESENNVDKDYQGENNLTERGHEQTRILTERLKEIPIDLMIVTSKKRSQQTTEIINSSLNVLVKENDLFIEKDEEFEKISPSPERTESFGHLVTRAKEAISFLENLSEEKIVIVTHGRFLKFLTTYILFKENLTEEMAVLFMLHTGTGNTGITMFKYDEEKSHWRLITWNDHGHLGRIDLDLSIALR